MYFMKSLQVMASTSVLMKNHWSGRTIIYSFIFIDVYSMLVPCWCVGQVEKRKTLNVAQASAVK